MNGPMNGQAQAETRNPSLAMGWLTVAVLFLLYILSLTDRYIIALVGEPMKRDLHLSDFELSILQGPAFALLYSLCAIPIGLALDRYGRRIVLFLSVTIWSAAATLCGVAPNYPPLAASRAILGLGEAGFTTGSYSVIGDSFEPGRVSLAMTVFVMGGVMGAGIVFLLGGPLVAALTAHGPMDLGPLGVLAPWRLAFIITGVPGLALAWLIFLFRETAGKKAGAAAGGGYSEALAYARKHAVFYLSTFVGISTIYAVTIGLQFGTPAHLARAFGWRPAQIGLSMGLAQILAALSLPIHGWIVDRLYKRGNHAAHANWCIGASILGIAAGAGAYLVDSPELCVILFGVYMVSGMASAGLGPALVQVATPASLRGRVSAMFVVFTGLISMGVGPTFTGLLTDYVYRDEAKVGLSLTTSVLVLLPLAMLVLSLGRGKLGAMIAEARPAVA